MKFPNAAKGVKKIFNAEIISLIAALIGGAGLIPGLIGASQETGDSVGTTLLAVSGALLIVSGIALLVAGIMNIIGFIQAAKDEEGIKRAVLCAVFSALFAFVAAFFENQTGFLGGLGTVLSSIATVLNMLVALFMIGGLMNLSAKCNRPDMVKRGHSYPVCRARQRLVCLSRRYENEKITIICQCDPCPCYAAECGGSDDCVCNRRRDHCERPYGAYL